MLARAVVGSPFQHSTHAMGVLGSPLPVPRADGSIGPDTSSAWFKGKHEAAQEALRKCHTELYPPPPVPEEPEHPRPTRASRSMHASHAQSSSGPAMDVDPLSLWQTYNPTLMVCHSAVAHSIEQARQAAVEAAWKASQ
jgi:hypothetical protein